MVLAKGLRAKSKSLALQQLFSKEKQTALMANTSKLSKEERKKARRAARKKRKAENPLKPREYARGSAKRKVKKMVRGTAKR
jgi:hypothetical protein